MSQIEFDLSTDTINWLIEDDDPGPHYLALLKLSKISKAKLSKARKTAHQSGEIKTVLDAMHPEGYWEEDKGGYLPKYRSAVWSLILLAQLGASASEDERIHLACNRYLDHALMKGGQISTSKGPSGTVDCIQGNMLSAFSDLGYEDERLELAYEWMARSVTGDGVAPMSEKKAPLRYYSGKIGPDFQCGANNKLACAWGASKVMLAFSKLPPAQRTTLITEAIQRGVDFLLATDPAEAGYPNGWNEKPSRNWWKFGFPVFYITDFLQITEALVRLGYAQDKRLHNALQLIIDKQNLEGNWNQEYSYTGKTWLDFGKLNTPNKWVTIRALETLNFLDDKPLIII